MAIAVICNLFSALILDNIQVAWIYPETLENKIYIAGK